MTRQNAEMKLYTAVAVAGIKGASLAPGTFATGADIDGSGTVCLCGSVLLAAGINVEDIKHMDGEKIIKTVARKLGITLKQAASLNNGFEAESKKNQHVVGTGWYDVIDKSPLARGVDSYWFNIGKKLRRTYDAQY